MSGVSGVVAGLEFGTNRPGSDYRNFGIGNADLRDQPELLCKKACESEAQCRSWTYVKPGIQGPNARCWLKSATPGAQANNCCISGVTKVNASTPSQPSTGSASPGGSGTTSSSIPPQLAEMLKAHNEKRALHGSPPLSWDAGLAAGAQSWAAACTRQHSGFDKGYGENLYWGTNQTARSAVDWWYAENKYYRWDDPITSYHLGDSDRSKEVRHFTQLVWKDTSKLGCGVAKCQNDQYFVCRYVKQGNFNGDNPGVLQANVPPKK